MTTVETPRLILRRWRDDDVAPLTAVNSDPEVMRWIGDGAVRDEERTRAGIEAMEREWESQGFGLFAVEERATGATAGFSGLTALDFLPEMMPAVEAGWRLGRRFWGRGLATEAARATLEFGFGVCGLDRIVSVAQTGNHGSVRIMDKLGMRLERESVDPTCGRRVHVYAISGGEWSQRP